jgi:putative hemolysin
MPPPYPSFPDRLPEAAQIRSGPYSAGFARTREELEEVQRLRFQVFNLELGEGLEESFATERDEDPYDQFCHHLIIRDERSGDIVGTYRMQDRAMAAAGGGFYSDNEYHLEQFPPEVLDDACELGRACIAEAHRSGRVLFLLWRGLFLYLQVNQLRYFFGCCSLTSQNPVDGWALHTRLRRADHLSPRFSIQAREAYQCPACEPTEIDIADVVMPRLMRLYLDYGAVMCSEPALDRDFKTIDFLAFFDRSQLPPKLLKVFQKDLA